MQSAGNVSVDACQDNANPVWHYLPYAPASGVAVTADATDGIMVVGSVRSRTAAEPENPAVYQATTSNYGACVDIWAPGDAIYSSWGALIGNTVAGTTHSNVQFDSGTSMAAPHVAAAAAYYADTYFLWTPYEIEQKIRQKAQSLGGFSVVKLQ